MKYPFLDTPDNRRLEELIAQCVEPEMIVSRDLGRFIFHVLPHGMITEVSEPDGWGLGVKYSGAHVAVIDKETGRFGMGHMLDPDGYGAHHNPVLMTDVKDLIKTLNEGDIKDIYARFPYLINLERDAAYTYHDHHQSIVAKRLGDSPYNKHIEWLIENGEKRVRSIDAPEEISRSLEAKLRTWRGSRNDEGIPSTGIRLLSRFSAYDKMRESLVNDFRPESLFRVISHLRDSEYRDSMKDIKTSLDPQHLRHSDLAIVLDLPQEEYHEGRDRMYDSMKNSYIESCEAFKNTFLESYRSSLMDRYMPQRDKMSEQEVETVVDRLMHYMRTNVDIAKTLASDTPSASRNKIQILDFFDGDERLLTAFFSDSKIKKGIEDGRPMKEVLGHLPLLNTSKRTVHAYMNNMKEYLRYNDSPVQLVTEKGISELTKLGLGSTSTIGNNLHNAIALITTLPEAHLIDESRNANKMIDVLGGFPGLIDSLSHRCLEAREGGREIRDAMSWVPREMSNMEKRPQTVRDAMSMFTDTYYETVIRHLKQHMIGTDDYQKYTLSRLRGEHLMNALKKTGEYRNILSFDDDIHGDIHHLFKAGRPETDIEWARTIEDDFYLNGYCISPITSNSELAQEGAELNHCVGSYLKHVLGNESYIFSVTLNGVRVSTIELREDSMGEVEIVQHFARKNTTPPAEAIDAANKFCEAINEEEIDFDASPCSPELFDEAFDDDMQVEREEVEFGLRFSDRDFVLHAINSMNRILPSFDVWEALEKEEIPALKVAELRGDFEKRYGEDADHEVSVA